MDKIGVQVNDSSFVVMTGPPQVDKDRRIRHVRSVIRKSRLNRESGALQGRQDRQITRKCSGTSPPTKELYPLGQQITTYNLDLSWLSVSEAVGRRLRCFFDQYVKSSAYLHPFFCSMIPLTLRFVPLMSTKLVHATAWDDLSGPNSTISALTLYQRDIAEGMLADSMQEAISPAAENDGGDVTMIALLSLLSFEIINGDLAKYMRHKTNISRILATRGGLDSMDASLRISLLVIYNLEPIIGFTTATQSLTMFSTDIQTLLVSQPADLKILTFQRGQAHLLEGMIAHSTVRLLSDFFQIVLLAARYNSLSESDSDPVRKERIRIQWQFLRDNIVAYHSLLVCDGTEPPIDEILLHAMLLFVSPSVAAEQSVTFDYIKRLKYLLQLSQVLELYHGPLPGALIWCIAIGARRSDPNRIASTESMRKWFVMQLMRITCPAALDEPANVSQNIDMILAGMAGVDLLASASLPLA